MVRHIHDGIVRINYAPTIANIAAPTVAEVETAGTHVTPYIQSLSTPLDGDTVDASDLASAFNVTAAGTFGGTLSGVGHRGDTAGDDTFYTLIPRLTTGYFVIRRFGLTGTALALADVVEVWPFQVITRNPSDMARNTLQTFNFEAAVSAPPEIDVAVV